MKSLRILRRIVLIAISLIILTLAAIDSNTSYQKKSLPQPDTQYPSIPVDLDPDFFDIKKATPSPSPLIQREITAEAYLVGNLDTGEIYFSRNTNTVFPIASLSKLTTALIALHTLPPEERITITDKILEDGYGEAGHLIKGEVYTVSELLYPLLLESSNDAAEALAQSYSHGLYDGFIDNINAFVREQGMAHTRYKDSSGINSANTSNAHDLFTLARYIYHSEPELLDITRQREITLATTTDHGSHTYKNINPFVTHPDFIGGKTGRTNEAHESMISLFRVNKNGLKQSIAIIVLRSDFHKRELDTSKLYMKFVQK